MRPPPHSKTSEQVDTAILTGEPFPRKVPDYDMEEDEEEEKEEPGDSGQCREDTKDASTDAARPRHHTRQGRKQQQQEKKKKIERRVLWAGCIVKTGEAYCRVQATGLRTEVGKAAKSIQANSAIRRRSLFEDKILVVANAIIGITLAVVVAILVLQIYGRRQEWKVAVVRALSLTIASVPVALPLVMNVMMAAGAHEMARQKALVTHLSALQEIASMDVLCSDKTGTLTTAQITVFADRIQAFPASHAAADACPAAEVLAYAALASNPHNKVLWCACHGIEAFPPTTHSFLLLLPLRAQTTGRPHRRRRADRLPPPTSLVPAARTAAAAAAAAGQQRRRH